LVHYLHGHNFIVSPDLISRSAGKRTSILLCGCYASVSNDPTVIAGTVTSGFAKAMEACGMLCFYTVSQLLNIYRPNFLK